MFENRLYYLAYTFDIYDRKNDFSTTQAKYWFYTKDFRDVLNKFVIAIYLAEKRAESTSEQEGYAYVDDINNEINEILKKIY